jgi:hypothetical protein
VILFYTDLRLVYKILIKLRNGSLAKTKNLRGSTIGDLDMTTTINTNVTLRNKTDLAHNIKAGIELTANNAIDGLMVVFSNQIENEVAINRTIYKNRMGFNKSDAKVLTQIAKDKNDGKELTDEQVAEVQRRIPKYTWQIMNTKIRTSAISKQNGIYIWR